MFAFFPVDLLGLLKWRSNTSLLQQNLRQLMKVDGGEVVKVRGPKVSALLIKLYPVQSELKFKKKTNK